MSRSLIRASQVLDTDFLSEDEFAVASGTINQKIVTTSGVLQQNLDNHILNGDAHWMVVSNDAELQDALSKKYRRIYLKAGPTYTTPITLYDGLNILGECLPSDEDNSQEDGVKLYNTGGCIWSPSVITYIAGHPCEIPVRGRNYLNIDPSPITIPAGSLLVVGGFTHLITETVNVSGTVIYIEDTFFTDDVTSTTCNIYKPSVSNVTIKNILVDTSDYTEAIEITYGKDIYLENISGVDQDYLTCSIKWSAHIIASRIRSNYYDDYPLYFNGCTLIDTALLGRSYRGGNYPKIAYFRQCGNFRVSDSRGGGLQCYRCFNYRIENCHSAENHSQSRYIFGSCKYFSVDGCSSGFSLSPFYFYNCHNFTLENSNVSNATDPVYINACSNYKISNNIWQKSSIQHDISPADGDMLYYDSTNSAWTTDSTIKYTNIVNAINHVNSTGIDHTYIDQDLRTTADPVFNDIHVHSVSINGQNLYYQYGNGLMLDDSNGNSVGLSDLRNMQSTLSNVVTSSSGIGDAYKLVKLSADGKLDPSTVPVASVAGKIGDVTLNTSDVSEHPSYLYYTDQRVESNAVVSGTKTKTDLITLTSGVNLDYISVRNTIDLDNLNYRVNKNANDIAAHTSGDGTDHSMVNKNANDIAAHTSGDGTDHSMVFLSNYSSFLPSATDDSTKGYEPRALWVYSPANRAFICTSNTVGNSSWRQISNSYYIKASDYIINENSRPTIDDNNSIAFQMYSHAGNSGAVAFGGAQVYGNGSFGHGKTTISGASCVSMGNYQTYMDAASTNSVVFATSYVNIYDGDYLSCFSTQQSDLTGTFSIAEASSEVGLTGSVQYSLISTSKGSNIKTSPGKFTNYCTAQSSYRCNIVDSDNSYIAASSTSIVSGTKHATILSSTGAKAVNNYETVLGGYILGQHGYMMLNASDFDVTPDKWVFFSPNTTGYIADADFKRDTSKCYLMDIDIQVLNLSSVGGRAILHSKVAFTTGADDDVYPSITVLSGTFSYDVLYRDATMSGISLRAVDRIAGVKGFPIEMNIPYTTFSGSNYYIIKAAASAKYTVI